jgi:hypothetical protein
VHTTGWKAAPVLAGPADPSTVVPLESGRAIRSEEPAMPTGPDHAIDGNAPTARRPDNGALRGDAIGLRCPIALGHNRAHDVRASVKGRDARYIAAEWGENVGLRTSTGI